MSTVARRTAGRADLLRPRRHLAIPGRVRRADDSEHLGRPTAGRVLMLSELPCWWPVGCR